jgi:predicted Zn-dependent protease
VTENLPREENERQRDVHAEHADGLLFGSSPSDENYPAAMSAAAAHASMAVYWQARIEWEHGA